MQQLATLLVWITCCVIPMFALWVCKKHFLPGTSL